MNTLPSEEEVWLLRCIDKHCRVPGQGCAFRIYSKGSDHPAAKEILARMDYEEFRTLAGGLQEYKYIGASLTSRSGNVWMTREGKAHMYEIVHPNRVEKAWQWACHHPLWSLVIILGSVAVWLSQWRACLWQ